jgi:DNA-binding Xre family transcriptional regulator
MQTVTDKLLLILKEKGYSVARLARETGIPEVSLWAMIKREDGDSWNVKTLKKICQVLDISVINLIDEQSKEKLSKEEREKLKNELGKAIDDFFRND